jgi:hypothetical protein
MSGTSMRTSPRGNIESGPRIDRLIGSERSLRDIRRAREYWDASGYAPLAYRSELSAGVALETNPRRHRTNAFGTLGGRFAVWLSRRFNTFHMG